MYDRYLELLRKKGVKSSDVTKATKIPASTFTDWKYGRSNPGAGKLQKIADYFGVSIDYLMTGKEKEDGYYANPETAKIAQEIFENKELRLLFDASRNAKPEDLKLAHDMLLALKRKERGDID